jgi:hypothetical protein
LTNYYCIKCPINYCKVIIFKGEKELFFNCKIGLSLVTTKSEFEAMYRFINLLSSASLLRLKSK